MIAVVLAALLAAMPLLASESSESVIKTEALPNLPHPIANNAVALLTDGDDIAIYSFLGLGAGKAWSDTSRAAMSYSNGAWALLDPVPGDHGRLAASAIAAGGEIYLFGGYTVASDHSEESTPEVYRLNRETENLEVFTTMPIPVEDSVLAVHEDRWIYMISGWHDLGNVNLVQVLDTKTGTWAQATPYPGAPVFGHAGGLADGVIVVCDGVKIEYREAPQSRAFLPADECWKGAIDPENYRRIDWRQIEPHPGKPLYRMAATSDGVTNIWFAGGSENPYNFNGTGYNGVPSEPESGVFRYDVSRDQWEVVGNLDTATMDHRGLLHHDGWFYIVGGMRAGQAVSAEFFRFRP